MKASSVLWTRFILPLKIALGKVGIFVSSTTRLDSIQNFFRLIRPLRTQHKLIRVGQTADGGYLVPNDLEGIDRCFSPGVSTSSDFELDLANRGISCYMADYSVEQPPIQHALFQFEKKFLGSENNEKFLTLESWVAKYGSNSSDMVLQMDIEGAEYEVIFNTPSEILNRFRIIIVEFHDLDQMLNKTSCTLIDQCFRKLLRDFEIVHLHPNNIMKGKRAIYHQFEIPSVIEATFLRKDRILSSVHQTEFPHPLDLPNSTDFDDYVLPRCWYSQS
jgi:hypothetical protein